MADSVFVARVSKAHKSRTIWFAAAVAILSVLQGFIFDLPLSPQYQALLGCVVSLVIVVLRYHTTGGMEDAE